MNKSIGENRISEGDHQVRLFRWAYRQTDTIPELGLLFHVPNGGARNASTAARLKLEGVKAGVPDICLPVARKGYHGLWIELKAEGGSLSKVQKDWLLWLREENYCAVVCYGAEAAYTAIIDYLDLDGFEFLLSLDEKRQVIRLGGGL